MLLECLFVTAIFGLAPVINKYMLKFVNINSIVIFTGICYFILSLFYFSITNKTTVIKDFTIMNQNIHLYILLFIFTLLVFIIGNYYYLTVIKDNKTYLVAAIVASYPLMTALFGYLFLNEIPTFKNIIGVLAIIFGLTLLNIK